MYKVSINGDCMEFNFKKLNAALTYIRAIAKNNDISSIYITRDNCKMPELVNIGMAFDEFKERLTQ